jgi:hypothetical protein
MAEETTQDVRDEIAELRAAIAEERQDASAKLAHDEQSTRLVRVQRERDALREELAALQRRNQRAREMDADEDRVVETRVIDPATGVYLDANLISEARSVEDMKMDELREQVRAHGLPVGGTKADLVKRLEEAGHGQVLVPNEAAAQVAAENKE